MAEENKESKIERLKKQLNSRSFSGEVERERFRSYKKEIDSIKTDWSHNESDDRVEAEADYQMTRKKRNFLKIFLTLSIIFFVLALGVVSYVIFAGSNIISSDNVEVLVSGPILIGGGETLSLNVIISNNNNTALKSVSLIVEYPEGARSHSNLSEELKRERFSLEDIGSGQKVNQEIKVILFGQEGNQEKIKLTVEYRISDSNAIFFKDKEYEIEISSAPVGLRIEALRDVNSGQEISLEISVKSNSSNLLEDVMFIAEYPFGFTFKESSPRPSFDQNIWKIGDLSPGEERKIRITGVLEGQDGEERVFRFLSGIQNADDEKNLQTAFISGSQSVFIKKPFLALNLVVDGNTSDNYSTSLGKIVKVDILWKNNLPTSIANVEIEAILSGDFSESSVDVERGFYNSVNNTVLWSQERNPIFESLSPGESGTVQFSFVSLDFNVNSLLNPETLIDVSVRGRRLSESGVSEEIVSSAQREIRFDTNLSLIPRIIHFSGPISNSGPIPPKAEMETTYTVIWTLSNNVNDVSDVVVSTSLPSYVRWTGTLSASGEKVTYNNINREVVWDVGALQAGSGFSSSPREVFFQIAFLPSLSQVGLSPILVGKTNLSGGDNFTGVVVGSSRRELTTKISTDSGYKKGDDKVVE